MRIDETESINNWFEQSEQVLSLNFLDIADVRSARDSVMTPQNWVDLLLSESWKTRQYASKQLENCGAKALPILINNFATNKDVEVVDRCRQVLSKYSNVFSDALPVSPTDCLRLIERLPESRRTDQALRKALNGFSEASVPEHEKRSIDKFFKRLSDDRKEISTNSGKLYFLKCLLADPERQYLRVLTAPNRPSQLSVNAQISVLARSVEIFPEIYKRDGFILHLTTLNSSRELRSEDASHRTTAEKTLMASMGKQDAAQLNRMLQDFKTFERGKEYEKFRSDYNKYLRTDCTDGERLVMRVLADPQLRNQPLVLLTLRRHEALVEKIARNLPQTQRDNFKYRVSALDNSE